MRRAATEPFLLFVVEETLAGRSDRMKAYTIGTSVLQRDEAFDPQSDPIVRIEASRLRRSLEHYYLLAKDDPIRIVIPRVAMCRSSIGRGTRRYCCPRSRRRHHCPASGRA